MNPKGSYGDRGLGLLAGYEEEPSTGWTYPSTIYDEMRRINATAQGLDRDVTAHVTRNEYLTAWRLWYDAWKQFFDKHLGEWTNTQKVLNAFQTDELKAQVDTRTADLHKFQSGYDHEVDPNGRPLPPRTSPDALPPPPPPHDEKKGGWFGLEIPWWVWALGGATLVGVGYLAYRSARAEVSVLQNGLSLLRSPSRDPEPTPSLSPALLNAGDPPTLLSQHGALYRKV